MNKNFTKTIMSLIVFVVFLGVINLDDVYAIRTECEYKYDDDMWFTIEINNNGGLVDFAFWDDTYSSGSFFNNYVNSGSKITKNTGNIDLRNWGSFYPDKKTGASGSSYYLNNENKCPPNLLYVETPYSHAIIFLNGDEKYETVVEEALEKEDNSIPSVGEGKDGIIKFTQEAASKTAVAAINGIDGAFNWVKNKISGSDDEHIKVLNHVTFKFDLTKENYIEEADPPNEEVIDDGKEREWDDPTVRPIDPLDEDKAKYSCGNGTLTGIPARIPKFGKFLYNFLQFLVPIVLVLMGTIDLIKAIVGSKEDDIKKNQSVFIKRLVSAVIVFFSFALVKLILSIASEDSTNIIQCVDCILRNSSNCIKEN